MIASTPFVPVYDDYPDAFIPELWANEALAVLEENMVVGNLVHRDFSANIAEYGDIVNTQRPGKMTAKRKTASDNVTVQTPTSTNVPVPLNQHLHTSFMIKDGDQSKSFKDLVITYLKPAMLSVASGVDQILSSQAYRFLPNVSGRLNAISGSNADAFLLGTRKVMNDKKAHVNGRNLVLGTVAENALLSNANYVAAYFVGDDGTALRNASLGRKLGFDTFMAQNTPYSLSVSTDKVTGAVNNAAGYAIGVKNFTVDGFSAAINAGSWITIAGDDTPLQVVSTTGGSTPTAIVTVQGLKTAVADNAVVTVWGVGKINQAGGYASGYAKELTYDTFTLDPQVGQGLTFTTGTTVYGIIAVDTTNKTITLDRPIEAALSDNDNINLLPAGSYNFAFHRDALALVSRPLALPMPGTGARAGVASYNGMSMRVVMTYDGNKQGTLVTVDTLLGVAVLDTDLGAVMLG